MTAGEGLKPPIDRVAPTLRPDDKVVMYQSWQELLFLHWDIDPAALQALIPPGLTVDTYEDRAYIGLVPFTMRGVRPVWSPSVPGISNFHECNVRTYVHAGGRDPGVWFFSLDAANPLAVVLARALWKLPYFPARMSLGHDREDTIHYSTRRVQAGSSPAACRVSYTPSGTPTASAVGTLEHFLAERYILYAQNRGHLWSGRVHHSPYPLQKAQLLTLEDTLVAAAGVRRGEGAIPRDLPLCHYAAGVDVEVFPLRPVMGIKAQATFPD